MQPGSSSRGLANLARLLEQGLTGPLASGFDRAAATSLLCQPPHENQLASIVQIAWEIAHAEPFRRQRMEHRRSRMQKHGDLVAMETQDERRFASALSSGVVGCRPSLPI